MQFETYEGRVADPAVASPAKLANHEKKGGTPSATEQRLYPPLGSETRTHVSTAQAAYYLNRAQQTLRIWACREEGPVRPIRVRGRLAWPVAELKRLLGLTQSEEQ